jgi:hypothetical protein
LELENSEETPTFSDILLCHQMLASCLVHLEKWAEAAVQFQHGRLFDKAVVAYFTARDMGSVRRILSTTSISLARNTKNRMRNYFARAGDFDSVERLSDSIDEMVLWLKQLMEGEFDIDRAKEKLCSLGRFDDAAEFAERQGNQLEAACLFGESGSVNSKWRMNEILLELLWAAMPLGWFGKADKQTKDEIEPLLCQAEELSMKSVSVSDVRLFRFIFDDDIPSLLKVSRADGFETWTSSFAALDHALKDIPMGFNPITSPIDYQAHRSYFQLIITRFPKVDPSDRFTQQLFGLRPAKSNQFRLLPLSPFHQPTEISPNAADQSSSTKGPKFISSGRALEAIKTFLADRMYETLENYHKRTRKLSEISCPCLSFTILGKCNNTQCSRLHSTESTLECVSSRLELLQNQFSVIRYFEDLCSILSQTTAASKIGTCRKKMKCVVVCYLFTF